VCHHCSVSVAQRWATRTDRSLLETILTKLYRHWQITLTKCQLVRTLHTVRQKAGLQTRDHTVVKSQPIFKKIHQKIRC